MIDFVTAAEEDFNPDERKLITMTVDGDELGFYEPNPGQQVVMMSMPRDRNDHRAVRNFLTLFFEMCDDETRDYLDERLLDSGDHFTIKHIFQIFEKLTGEWSGGKATSEPSDYRPPSRSIGRNSTGSTPRRASTSRRSASRGSSTSSSGASATD